MYIYICIYIYILFCALWNIFLCGVEGFKKNCIQETLNLLTCADSRTNAKQIKKNKLIKRELNILKLSVRYKVSGVRCHVSAVSPVTCHLSQPQTLPLLTPPLCTAECFFCKAIFDLMVVISRTLKTIDYRMNRPRGQINENHLQ